MRTNIVIDDQLMAAAMQAGNFKTKKAAVEAGLRLITRGKVYAEFRAARGTLHWDASDEAWAQVRDEKAAQSLMDVKSDASLTAPYKSGGVK